MTDFVVLEHDLRTALRSRLESRRRRRRRIAVTAAVGLVSCGLSAIRAPLRASPARASSTRASRLGSSTRA